VKILKYIYKNFFYSNDYILQLLTFFKNQIPFSENDFNELILNNNKTFYVPLDVLFKNPNTTILKPT